MWTVRWNFDRPSYEPGSIALVNFWLENNGDSYLYLSDLEIAFDFGTYNLEISGTAPPRSTKFLGCAKLQLPKNVVGRRLFAIRHRMSECVANNWIDLGVYQYDKRHFLSVCPKPLYRVFVSRGLTTEDRAIGDTIVGMIKEWGFETVTVGIEVEAPEKLVPDRAKEEIMRSDALIAIATPRHLDALTGLWKTLEWLHGEVGIAFGLNKPLLILRDKRVSLGGLPGYLSELRRVPAIEFDPYDLENLRSALAAIMPGFRDWIETKRRQEFFEGLGRLLAVGILAIGTAAILSGVVGSLLGSSKK